jgi:titin
MTSRFRPAPSPSRDRLSVESLEDRLAPATFTVTKAGDAGLGSLRRAIHDANANPGADVIVFDIPGAGAHTITPTSALPAITDRVTVAGHTQPGFAGTPLIELSGAMVGEVNGLVLLPGASGSVVRGLVLNRFNGSGLHVRADNCRVVGNYIGTDAAGAGDLGNRVGVRIGNGSGNTIGGTTAGARNVISGNDDAGVRISGAAATANVVQGNFIGTDVTGTADLGNTFDGARIDGGAHGNLVGGSTAGARNVISGNGVGTKISGTGTTGNAVRGNFIGTDASGAADLGNSNSGVVIEGGASGNVVGGTAAGARNVISGNDEYGVRVLSGGTAGNRVLGNYIGTDVTGTIDLGNVLTGVILDSEARDNVVGGTAAGARNVISGNGQGGVHINGPLTTGNVVLGNYLGTDLTGTVHLGNSGPGVLIAGAARGNVVGGTATGGRNLVSGNDGAGVMIVGFGTTGNVVLGNYIGTDVTGTADLGNAEGGVLIVSAAAGNVVGGTAAGAGNVISGNDAAGVTIDGLSGRPRRNTVLGNFIGTDASGAADLGNTGSGVLLTSGASENTIGGAVAGARNVISGNDGHGVEITGVVTDGNRVQGNRIGLPATGSAALGNALDGVRVDDDANRNVIGGAQPGPGNVIAHNGGSGVGIVSGTRNSILGNRVFGNGGLGIDLLADGVTPNDLDDPDPGPNELANFPELSFARITATGLRVRGLLNTQNDRTQRVEFFASPSADPTGHGEGARYLGAILLDMAGVNTLSFTALLPVSGVEAGWVVTATATDELGNTSEFSAARPVI